MDAPALLETAWGVVERRKESHDVVTLSQPQSSSQEAIPCKRCGAPVYPSAWRRKTFKSFYCSRDCYNGDVVVAPLACAQCGVEFKGDRDRKYCSPHSCDNTICCNPDHLWVGSALDNLVDAQVKGILASGDNHWTRRQAVEANGPISEQQFAEVVAELIRLRAAVDEALRSLGMAA